MIYFNRSTVCGLLNSDPAVIPYKNGERSIRVELAVITRRWRRDGTLQESQTLVIVDAYGGLGTMLLDLFREGDAVMVEGHLETDVYGEMANQRFTRLVAERIFSPEPDDHEDVIEQIEDRHCA